MQRFVQEITWGHFHVALQLPRITLQVTLIYCYIFQLLRFLILASKSQREFHIFRSHLGPYFCPLSIAYSVSYKISWICHVKFVGNVHCTTIGNTIDAVITNVGPSLRRWHSYVPVRR